jgi:hypothetical protein
MYDQGKSRFARLCDDRATGATGSAGITTTSSSLSSPPLCPSEPIDICLSSSVIVRSEPISGVLSQESGLACGLRLPAAGSRLRHGVSGGNSGGTSAKSIARVGPWYIISTFIIICLTDSYPGKQVMMVPALPLLYPLPYLFANVSPLPATFTNFPVKMRRLPYLADVKDLGFIGSWRQEQTIELTRARLILALA